MSDSHDNLLSPEQEESLQGVFDRLASHPNFKSIARRVMLSTLREAYCAAKPWPLEEMYPYNPKAIYVTGTGVVHGRAALGLTIRDSIQGDINATQRWFSMKEKGISPAKRIRFLHYRTTGEKLS